MPEAVQLAGLISRATGHAFKVDATTPIAAGSIHRAVRIDNVRTGTPASVFAKVGDVAALPLFEAERKGLEMLAAAGTPLITPKVWHCGTLGEEALLVLEWLDLQPLIDSSARRLGAGLALLHRTTAPQFGLDHDNFIGATPQSNTQHADWVAFWQHCRLVPQLRLAAKNRYPSRLIDRGKRLAADCGALIGGHAPQASLLHGDLWGGNAAMTAGGLPAIYDPAIYFGDREVDLAMTELFGGFPKTFATEYANAWPLDAGYATRKHFYNLYHVLNHANLFSGDYVRQAETLIEKLLAEL